MSQTIEIKKLDAVISILENSIDDLDNLRELLVMPRIGRPAVNPDPAISVTNLLMSLFGVMALVTCGIQIGILHGRASCPTPIVARMGS